MALFSSFKKKKEEKKEAAEKPRTIAVREKKVKLAEGESPSRLAADIGKEASKGQKQERVSGKDVSSVLIRPRITEKATMQAEKNVYVFEVKTDTSKRDVREAVVNLYKVHPVKVNVVKMSPQKVVSRMRGTRGTKAGYKKAYVYLKKGDRIEII